MYQIHMRAKGGTQMPTCSYGAACERRDCVYRHPKKSESVAQADAPICAAYIVGECRFGKKCRNRHVSEEEAQRIRERNANTPCRFGSRCTTVNCLFRHPPPEPCFYGARCTNPDCRFGHPVEEEIIDEISTVQATPKEPAIEFPKSETLQRRIEEQDQQTSKVIPSVRVPQDAWVASWARNPNAYDFYVDPYDRFLAVNASSPRGVIDLHYQTIETVIDVMTAALNYSLGWHWQFYDEAERSVWIITGAGKHSIQKGRTLIYDVVSDYLKTINAKFKIAKDSEGLVGGFLLYL